MYRETGTGNTGAKSNFIQAIDKNINEFKLYQSKCSDLDKKLNMNLIQMERESYMNQQIFFQIKRDLASKAKTQLNLKSNNQHQHQHDDLVDDLNRKTKRVVPRYFDLINIRQSNSASSLRAFLIRSIKQQETLSHRSMPINARSKLSFSPTRSDSTIHHSGTNSDNNSADVASNDLSTNHVMLPGIVSMPNIGSLSQPPPKPSINSLNQMLQKNRAKSKSFRQLPTIQLEFGPPGSDSNYSNGSLSDLATSSRYSSSTSSSISSPSKYKSIRRERASAKKLNERHDSKATIIRIQKKYDSFGNICTKYFKHIHDNY